MNYYIDLGPGGHCRKRCDEAGVSPKAMAEQNEGNAEHHRCMFTGKAIASAVFDVHRAQSSSERSR